MTTASSYLDHLPMLYRDDPVLGRFLRAFESILGGGAPGLVGIEQNIERLDRYARPRDPGDPDRAAPAEFLPWLASWIGFALRHDWSERQRRDLLAEARWLYDRRGTAEGLRRFLELGLAFDGLNPAATILDRPDDVAGHFEVRLNPGTNRTDEHLHIKQVAREIIDREKPAHTWYTLVVRAPPMRIANQPTAKRPGIRVGHTLLGSDVASTEPPDEPPIHVDVPPDEPPIDVPPIDVPPIDVPPIDAPPDQPPSVTSSAGDVLGPVGAMTSDPFDDAVEANGRSISRLLVRAGDIIDGLQATHGALVLPQRGGEGGDPHTIKFSAKDPLVEVSGHFGRWFGYTCILQLSCKTRSGAVSGPYGTMAHASDPQPFRFTAPPGRQIVGFLGSTMQAGNAEGTTSTYLTALGVVVRDDPPRTP